MRSRSGRWAGTRSFVTVILFPSDEGDVGREGFWWEDSGTEPFLKKTQIDYKLQLVRESRLTGWPVSDDKNPKFGETENEMGQRLQVDSWAWWNEEIPRLPMLCYLSASQDLLSVCGLVTKSCPTLVSQWTVACQALLPMGFSRQEYWSGLPLPSPGDLPDPEIEPGFPTLREDSLPTEPPGKPVSLSRWWQRYWHSLQK